MPLPVRRPACFSLLGVRRTLLLAAIALSGMATGCGERAIRPALPAVKLTIDRPFDAQTIDAETVEVSGRVQPGDARVLVDGESVSLQNGAFTKIVALDDGVNVIDIQAGAADRPAAMTALRVVREVRVEIPVDIEDQSAEAALDQLSGLGLETETFDSSTLLDAFDFGETGVCGTEPAPGTRVLAGSSVKVYVAAHC